VLGTAALSGGTAAFGTSALGGGSHTVVAAYLGDGNYAPATSAGITQPVAKVSTSVDVAIDPLSLVFGSSVAIVAMVGPIPAGGQGPAGNVYFWDGATLLGHQPLAGGTATFVATGLAAGAHVLGASFDGDANYGGPVRKDAPVSIARAGVGVDLTSAPNPSIYGATVSYTAHVTSPAGIPGGTVTFYRDVSTSLGTAPVDASGFATLVTSGVPGGTHPVSAYYEGTPSFAPQGSTISVNQLVNAAQVTAVLSSSSNPSVSGQLVTLSCQVTSVGAPTGSVNLRDGSTVISQATQPTSNDATSATWTFATSALAAGSHSLACDYLGDGNFAPATSPPLVQTVNSTATTTTLAASPNPVLDDKPVTFTATVSAAGGTPTGTVTFLDGTRTMGTGTLSLGKASLVVKSLNQGLHAVTAVYGGSPAFAGSTSATLSLKVLEDYSCTAYYKPLVSGGTVSAPTKSGNFAFGTKVAVKWQFKKPSGAYVNRSSAVTALTAVFDSGCAGRPLAGAARIPLFDPASGPVAGSTFTYDTAANQYGLTWDTSKASKGCWDIVLTPDNGIPQVATIVKLQ
jgi:hypothetical protein